jgi:gluconolactonase
MMQKRFSFIPAILVLWLMAPSAVCQSPVITNPVVEEIWSGFEFVEGPVWVDTLGLLFSDIPKNRIYRFDHDSMITVFLNPSGNSNGLALDHQGRLLMAQHGSRQVARLEANGTLTPLATHYDGKRLNSPNDLAVKSDGSIFFTDPPYGISSGEEELGYYGIYRISPTGEVQLLDNSLNRPNGIVFSPDESKLYVNDSETRRIYVWDVVDDSTLAGRQQFAYMPPPGYADGMKADSLGYLYSTGPMGIWVFSPGGTAVDTIPVPGQTTNCGWGGPKHDVLYVTSGSAVYRIRKGEPVSQPVAVQETLREHAGSVFCFPNPFNSAVRFEYRQELPGKVKMQVCNTSGQQVACLVNRFQPKGNYVVTWETTDWPAGRYFILSALPGDGEICMSIVKL